MGVCKGLAQYFDVSAFWLRVAVVVLTIPTGIFPLIVAYILAGLIMKPEPGTQSEI